MRVGYTPIGMESHPAPTEGRGLECDKMSQTALDAHWNGFMQKALDDIGPLAGTALNASLIDSYEVGNQDWTENFRAEFKKTARLRSGEISAGVCASRRGQSGGQRTFSLGHAPHRR